MNLPDCRDDGRARVTPRPLVSAISVLLLLAVLGVVLFITLRAPLKDDIAWLLYVARRWMGGQELYVDLLEVNPPLIIWISALPLEIANWLNVKAQFVAMPLFIAAVLGCAWWSASLLRDRRGFLADRLPVFAVVGSALLVLPGADIGQREHLLVAAFLPYLVLFARSLEGRRNAIAVSLWAGVLAGIGCALKPRYGAVFAVLECLALTRGLRPWRMMPVAAGTTLLGYSALVAILWPAYFQRAVPLALALYGATDVPFQALLSNSAPLLAGECMAVGLLWLRRRSLPDYSLMLTMVVFAATSTAICFVDGKDWYYHRLPAILVTVLALVLWTVTEIRQRQWVIRAPLVGACLAVLVFLACSLRQYGARDRQGRGAAAECSRAAGADHPTRARPDVPGVLRMDRPGLSRGQQHGRELGLALRFDVGVEGRGLAGPFRSGHGRGMADRPLGGA